MYYTSLYFDPERVVADRNKLDQMIQSVLERFLK